MKLVNRVIGVFDRKTGMRLTDDEWCILDSICVREHLKRRQLLEVLETVKNPHLGLTSSVRLFTILYLNLVAHGDLPRPTSSELARLSTADRLAEILKHLA
jgi:predicted DNA-binding ribbon-helix-helix protein